MGQGEITFECKYCRAKTTHIITSKSERAGRPSTLVRCMVCKYEKMVYRDNTGKLQVDQSQVPKRMIVLPYDVEKIQSEIVSEHQEQELKKIDDWLVNPDWYAVTKRKKGR